MITSFLEWIQNKEFTVFLEKTQDEAEEFLGQGYDAKHPVILGVLQKYNVPFDNWGGPQADDSVAKITKIIDLSKASTISPQKINQLDNFANKSGDQAALQAINGYLKNPQGDPRQAYVQAMEIRDKAEGRQRGYGDVGYNYDSIIKGSYEPPVLFNGGGKLIVIGGRTRLYAALLAQKPITVKIINEKDIASAFSAQTIK